MTIDKSHQINLVNSLIYQIGLKITLETLILIVDDPPTKVSLEKTLEIYNTRYEGEDEGS